MSILDRIKHEEEQLNKICNNNSLLALQILINGNELTKSMANGDAYFFTNEKDGRICYSKKKYPTDDDVLVYLDENDQKFIESIVFMIDYLNKKNRRIL